VKERLAEMTDFPTPAFRTRELPLRPEALPKVQLEELAVDLWVAPISAVIVDDVWSAPLTQDERERAQRFRFEEDKRRFLCGRGALRTLAGGYLGADPAALRFVYSEAGKPGLAPEAGHPALRFNLSHSGDYVLLGFAWGRAVGVDVELVRKDIEAEQIARRFFSQREQQDLLSLPASDRIPAFFRCWTRKEAYVKATGEGLGLPLNQFDVAFLPGKPAALLATRPDPAEALHWVMHDIDLGQAYAAAAIVGSFAQPIET